MTDTSDSTTVDPVGQVPNETPRRIQRSRRKGWTMPPNTIAVGRPGKWGNPFVVGKDGDAVLVVAKYKQWLMSTTPEAFSLLLGRMRHQLGGKNLACWCPLGAPCHADVLLKLANQSSDKAVTHEG